MLAGKRTSRAINVRFPKDSVKARIEAVSGHISGKSLPYRVDNSLLQTTISYRQARGVTPLDTESIRLGCRPLVECQRKREGRDWITTTIFGEAVAKDR